MAQTTLGIRKEVVHVYKLVIAVSCDSSNRVVYRHDSSRVPTLTGKHCVPYDMSDWTLPANLAAYLFEVSRSLGERDAGGYVIRPDHYEDYRRTVERNGT